MEGKVKLLQFIRQIISYLNLTRDYDKCGMSVGKSIWFLQCFLNTVNATGHLIFIIYNSTYIVGDILGDVLFMVSFGTSLLFNLHYAIFKKQIIILVSEIGDYTSCTTPTGAKDLDKKFTKFLKIYVALIMIAVIAFYIATIKYHISFKECTDQVFKCLLYNTIIPFEIYHVRPMKEIIYHLQFFTSVNSMLMWFLIPLFYTLIFDHLTHRIILLKPMIRMIRHIPEGLRRKHLKFCIQSHQEIIDMYYSLENITYFPFLIIILMTPIYINLTIFSLLLSPYLPIGIILCIFANMMICISSSCEHIKEHSTSLASQIFYSIPWNGDIRLQKDMIFFAARCNIPITITGGKVGVISRSLILAVLRLAYSISAIFFRFVDEEQT